MKTSSLNRVYWSWMGAFVPIAGVLLAACQGDDIGAQRAALEAVCAEGVQSVPAGAWQCPDPWSVECTGGDGTSNVDFIYLVREGADAGASACGEVDLSVSDPGPYPVGVHEIDVFTSGADGGLETLCTAELTVTDTVAPVIEGRTIVLWPPNHEMHAITAADCVEVRDACNGTLEAHFTHVSSDEPYDARGDGHHAPDIVVDDACEAVQVRAERRGGGNGRVYTLEVEATDGAGNTATGSCRVLVPHDHSSDAAIDGGPAITVDVPACEPEGQ